MSTLWVQPQPGAGRRQFEPGGRRLRESARVHAVGLLGARGQQLVVAAGEHHDAVPARDETQPPGQFDLLADCRLTPGQARGVQVTPRLPIEAGEGKITAAGLALQRLGQAREVPFVPGGRRSLGQQDRIVAPPDAAGRKPPRKVPEGAHRGLHRRVVAFQFSGIAVDGEVKRKTVAGVLKRVQIRGQRGRIAGPAHDAQRVLGTQRDPQYLSAERIDPVAEALGQPAEEPPGVKRRDIGSAAGADQLQIPV